MENFGLESIEGKTISLQKTAQQEFKADCLNLVGKVITNKELAFKTIKNTLIGVWGNPEGMSISEVDKNKVLVSFKNKMKGLQILKGGPWNVRGHILNLQMWMHGDSISEVRHDFLEIWVQIHGLPQEFINVESAKEIGNKIGLVVEAEDPMVGDTLERIFLRVKVAIPVSKPIPTGFYLNRDRLPKTWIQLKYERILESYCLNCGIIGHNKKDCKNPTVMSTWNPNEPRYSAGLGVAQARALKPKEYRVSREESSSGQNQREVAREEHDWRKGGESTQETAGSKADSAQEKEWGIEEDSIAEAPRRSDKEDHRDVEKGKNILEDLLVTETETEEVERDARDWVKENKNIKGSKMIYEKGKEMGGPSVLREESAIKSTWADFCQRPNENIFKIGPQEEDNNLTIGQPLKRLNNKELEQDNKQIYIAADGGVYYVELANEEEELEPKNSKALVVATGYEMKLVQGMEKKLKLKRKREDEQQLLMGNMVGEKAALQVWKAGKRSKQSSGPAGAMSIEEDQQNKEEIIEDSMAEEAGLNMPPTQP
ncbi:hypothetical protein Ahy_B09g096825 [Arachis hypogaea]|uniref:CCHC-type domain-containing protein n=1 Tax=Arachis hypogaea TaxID=3818 RepID=A0A444XMI0_ARAHY|nr:hypothetical protein Ahy_B09g096825 [Arachis hypogaea]